MLKAEAINQAYSQIRISGLTTQEVPEEVNVAIRELDQLMAVWQAMGRDINYHFPLPTPGNELIESDPNDTLGVPAWAVPGVITSLARHLVTHFGKDVPASLDAMAKFSVNVIKQKTFKANPQQYPHRMPLGSGNRQHDRGYIARFYYPVYQGRGDKTEIVVTQNLDMTADFSNDLRDAETVESYTIAVTAGGGITLVSDILEGNVVLYRVLAVKDRNGKVQITATTSLGMVIPKAYCFDTKENTCVVTSG